MNPKMDGYQENYLSGVKYYSSDSNRKFIFLAMVSNATDDIYLDVVVQI